MNTTTAIDTHKAAIAVLTQFAADQGVTISGPFLLRMGRGFQVGVVLTDGVEYDLASVDTRSPNVQRVSCGGFHSEAKFRGQFEDQQEATDSFVAPGFVKASFEIVL